MFLLIRNEFPMKFFYIKKKYFVPEMFLEKKSNQKNVFQAQWGEGMKRNRIFYEQSKTRLNE